MFLPDKYGEVNEITNTSTDLGIKNALEPCCGLTRRTVRSRTVLRVILLTIRFIVYVCVVIEFMVLIIPCYHISYL